MTNRKFLQPVIRDVSPSVRRALSGPRPSWRGRLHRIAIPLSVVAGVFLILWTPEGHHRVGSIVFVLGAVSMFTASGIVHLRSWRVPVWEMLYRLDHAAIFLLIASSATPLALSVLDGKSRQFMLWTVWAGAVLGIVMRLLPFHPPKGLMNTLFICLGGVSVLVAPDLLTDLQPLALILLIVELVLYVVGALMLGAQWPSLHPRVFGYHELWHTLVFLAVAAHFGVVLLVVNA